MQLSGFVANQQQIEQAARSRTVSKLCGECGTTFALRPDLNDTKKAGAPAPALWRTKLWISPAGQARKSAPRCAGRGARQSFLHARNGLELVGTLHRRTAPRQDDVAAAYSRSGCGTRDLFDDQLAFDRCAPLLGRLCVGGRCVVVVDGAKAEHAGQTGRGEAASDELLFHGNGPVIEPSAGNAQCRDDEVRSLRAP